MSKAVPVAIPIQNIHTFIESLPDDHRKELNIFINNEKNKIEVEAKDREVKLNQRIYILETQVKILKVYRDWFLNKSGLGSNDNHIVNKKVAKLGSNNKKSKHRYDSDDYSSSSSSESDEEDPVYDLAEALGNIMKKG